MKYLFFIVLLVLLTACSSNPVTPTQTIAELVMEDEQFSLLESALEDAGLLETLGAPGPFTVFAPTDVAFQAFATSDDPLPPSTEEGIRQILLYHVADKKLEAKDLISEATPIKTRQGADLLYTVEDGKVVLQDGQARTVNVTKTDIQATNGVIHVIDAVLLLPSPAALR